MVRSENDIWQVVMAVVRAGVAESHPGTQVRRAYQQTAQHVSDEPQVTLYRIGNRRVGSMGKSERWDEDGERMIQVETWRQELTIQAGAILRQRTDPAAATGADVMELLASWLHGDPALAMLRGHGIGILRITDLREIPLRDEAEQYAINANFDFTLAYTQSRERAVPVADCAELIIHRV